MREPVDWLGSWYRFRQRPSLSGQAQSTSGITFDDFVQANLQGQPPPFANVGSQAKFLEPRPNGTAVTHLFAYDALSRLDDFLSERLGAEIVTSRENVSPPGDLSLAPRTEKRLRRRQDADFALYDSIPH
jgi:hypothetical protein